MFGLFAPHPQQVGESNTLTLRNPKEPKVLNVAFAPLDLLVAVVAPYPFGFGGFDALAVDDGCIQNSPTDDSPAGLFA